MAYNLLYEINQQIEQIIMDAVDPETGELLYDIDAELEKLHLDAETLLENQACFVKNLEAEAEALKAEEAKLAARRKRVETLAITRKQAIRDYMLSTGRDKLRSSRIYASFRRSQAVEIQNMKEFLAFAPASLLRTKDPEPNKAAIKEAIQAGIEVAGAEIVINTNLVIK